VHNVDTQAKIAYYDMEECAEGPAGSFKLLPKHVVFLRPNGKSDVNVAEESATGALQTAAACHVPLAVWSGLVTQVIWSCKWATAGLTPVRPTVVLLDALVLPPQTAVALAPAP
jgi:hypothetical protein